MDLTPSNSANWTISLRIVTGYQNVAQVSEDFTNETMCCEILYMYAELLGSLDAFLSVAGSRAYLCRKLSKDNHQSDKSK